MSLSLPHVILLLIVVLILFGAGRLPKVMGDLGKGMKAFKKGLHEDDEDEAKVKKIDNNADQS